MAISAMCIVYADPRAAYLGEFERLLAIGHSAPPIIDPDSPASGYGKRPRPSIEIFGGAFHVVNPAFSIVSPRHAPFNLGYAVGQLLWTLAGSDDISWITYYRGHRPRPTKSAYGHRMMSRWGDQLSAAITRLRHDPGSRRALAVVFAPSDPLGTEEMPCMVGVQLFVRNDALFGVTMMRAQNALAALPMDMFISISLVQAIADRMGLALGGYTHLSTTFHAFRDEVAKAPRSVDDVDSFTLGRMSGFAAELNEILSFERRLRDCVLANRRQPVHAMGSTLDGMGSEFGRGVKMVLVADALRRLGSLELAVETPLPAPLLRLVLGQGVS